MRHFVVGLSEKSKKVAARSLVAHDDNDLHLVVPLFPNPYPLEAWLRLAPVQHLQVGIGDLLSRGWTQFCYFDDKEKWVKVDLAMQARVTPSPSEMATFHRHSQ